MSSFNPFEDVADRRDGTKRERVQEQRVGDSDKDSFADLLPKEPAS
jgi:hypothetical protein